MFAGFACAVLLALDIGQIWKAHAARLQQVLTDTDNLARSLAQHAEDIFETTDATAQSLRTTIVDDGTGPEAIARLTRQMRAPVATSRFLRGAFVFDENGNWLATSLPVDAFKEVRNLKYADRDFFRFHRDHPEDVALIGPPIRTKLDGTWVVTLSRRLNHPDGRFAGVVDTSIDLELFQKFFQTFAIGERGAITLSSGDGRMLVRRPFDAANIGRDFSQTELFRQIAKNAPAGSFAFTSPVDGISRVGSFRRVPGFDLVMVVALDRDEALAGWTQDTRTQLAWMAAIMCMVAALGYRLMIQIRDRMAAESVAARLRAEAEERDKSEAERRVYESRLEQSNADLAALNDSIRRSETRFRQLVEAAPNAMVMVDGAGRIEMVNAQTERLFGYSRAELLGAAVEKLVPVGSRAVHSAVRKAFVAHHAPHPMGAGRALLGRRQDGSAVELEIALSPIETDAGVKVLSVIVDISERVRLEAELRQSQKLEAIGRVAAGVAHDFNNLLQALGGSLDLLLGEVSDRPAAVQWGEVAQRAAARGKDLTDRLLSFSRKQHLTPRPILISELFAELKGLIGHLFETNSKARTELLIIPCQNDLTVHADYGQLVAALINLAVNARDAMNADGCLRLSAYAAEADPQIVPYIDPNITPGGRFTVISVADTGCGMDAATLRQAFEPFFTTKGVDGTGLGLSMVHGFARQSGGAANIASVVGEGTTIDLWLPHASTPSMVTAVPAIPVRTQGRVLVVDDSQDALLVVAAFLRHAGLDVTCKTGGDPALAELASGKRFDAIVTDFAMPGMNGLELLRRARQIDPSMAGMIITGFSDPELLSPLNDALVLRKPFNRAELTHAVQAMIARKRAVAGG